MKLHELVGDHEFATPEETYDFGCRVGALIRGGEVFLLAGGLGAGKTLLTKGVLDGVGYDPDEVTSPSFTLVNLYRTEKFPVFHLDLWRLDERSDAAYEVGLEEILEDPNAVVLIEWPERLGQFLLPRDVYRISIRGDGEDIRRITVEALKKN